MVLPTVATDELARRLHIVYPAGPLDQQLDQTVDTAVEMLAQQVDDGLVNRFPNMWAQAVIGTAVKVWDAGPKGLSGMDAVGEFTFPSPQASANILAATAGLWAPLALTGGNVIA